MKPRSPLHDPKYLLLTILLSQGISFNALAHEGEVHTGTGAQQYLNLRLVK